MPEISEVEIDQIKIDRQIQPREGLDDERIKLFHELYLDKDKESEPPPPLTVFHDAADDYWLSDGFHRYEAALAARSEGGPSKLPVEIYEGDRRDAFLYAVRVNGKHGKELTRQEKRNAVCRMVLDSEWSKWSVRKIARHTGTSISLVSNVRSELQSQNATVHDEQLASSRTVEYERAGKRQTMKGGNIGRAGRKSKAKTKTTATTPDSPAITQDERPTDDDKEPQTDDNREVVESGTIMGINRTDDSWTDDSLRDSDDDKKSAPPKGFINLIDAWFRATSEERQTFKDWVRHRSIDEVAGSATPEQHASFYLIGLESGQNVAEAYRAMR